MRSKSALVLGFLVVASAVVPAADAPDAPGALSGLASVPDDPSPGLRTSAEE